VPDSVRDPENSISHAGKKPLSDFDVYKLRFISKKPILTVLQQIQTHAPLNSQIPSPSLGTRQRTAHFEPANVYTKAVD